MHRNSKAHKQPQYIKDRESVAIIITGLDLSPVVAYYSVIKYPHHSHPFIFKYSSPCYWRSQKYRRIRQKRLFVFGVDDTNLKYNKPLKAIIAHLLSKIQHLLDN